MKTESKWWGYLHTNNSINVKRFGPLGEDDIREASKSPFCKRVYGPFPAINRIAAIKIISNIVNGQKKKNMKTLDTKIYNIKAGVIEHDLKEKILVMNWNDDYNKESYYDELPRVACNDSNDNAYWTTIVGFQDGQFLCHSDDKGNITYLEPEFVPLEVIVEFIEKEPFKKEAI